MSKLFGVSIDSLLDNKIDIPLLVLHEKIKLKDYGKGLNNQHKNLINKNFDETWKVYVLTCDDKVGSAGSVVDFLTMDISTLVNATFSYKTQYYLAVKGNYRLFVCISKDSFDVKALPSDTNVKKFNLDNKTYKAFSEFKRY